MIKNLQKNKHNQSVIVSIEQKIEAEIELVNLKSSYTFKFNRLNELRSKEIDLENEIYLLENSGNAYDEFAVERKKQELSKLPSELESAELEFQETNNRIDYLENLIRQVITVSVNDIIKNKSLITDELKKIDALDEIARSHSDEIQKRSVPSNTAAPLISQKSSLSIDSKLGIDNATELDEITVKISEAIANDEIINSENQKVITEKNSHIVEINKRIAAVNENIKVLKNRHKKLLGEMLSTLIEEQYDFHLKAIEDLKNSLKTSAELERIFSEKGITSLSSKFNFTHIISVLSQSGLLEKCNNINSEIACEAIELKNKFHQQGVFLDV